MVRFLIGGAWSLAGFDSPPAYYRGSAVTTERVEIWVIH